MKNLVLIIVLFVISISVQSQITLENSYSIEIWPILIDGKELVYVQQATSSINIYNASHSLWKSIPITIPSGYSHYNIGMSHYLNTQIPTWSRTLFDNDSSDLEFIIYYGQNNPPYTKKIEVIDENGNSLFSELTGTAVVMYSSNGYKLMTLTGDSTTGPITNIYSLPGAPLHIAPTGGSFPEENYFLSTYPNPSSDITNIEYNLPPGMSKGEIILYSSSGIEVKRLNIDTGKDVIQFPTNGISSGVYYYVIQSNSGRSLAKKHIFIDK